jgi:hypothetical protein
MGKGLIAKSKHSNSTFIMLYLYPEVNVDYLVVDEMINVAPHVNPQGYGNHMFKRP